MRYSVINLAGMAFSIGSSVWVVNMLNGSFASILATVCIFIGGCIWMIPTKRNVV